MFFDFKGQKVLLKAKFEGTPVLLVQVWCIFRISMLAASILSTCGSERTRNDKVMTVLVNIGPFYDSP